jgi:carboxypeptidase family protein/Big-like domain-containing protein
VRHLIILAAALAFASCGRLLSDPDTTTVKSLIVAGTPPTVGTSSQFTAVAVRTDGTTDGVTAQAAWRSSNTAVATVSSNGVVEAVSRGTVEIAATYGGAKGAFSFDIAAATSFTLSGAVTDATTRLPIAGAAVVARDASGTSRTATTNSTGRYSIPDLPSGALDISVRADGYAPSLQSARLTADLTIDVALARASDCTVIGFDGLARTDTFSSYAACGFTVTATTSNWSVSTTTGRPPPFVAFTSRALASTAGEVIVTAAAQFKFQSVDLYSSTTPVLYTITGIANGTAAASLQNTLGTTGDFVTISNTQTSPALDALVIRLTTPVTSCCASTIGIDNVVLVR